MSDDLNKKIKQVADLLSQEGAADNLKGLLSGLLGSNSGGNKDESSSKRAENNELSEEKSERSEMDESLEMIRKATTLMNKIKSNNDPRINLITALKPFMSEKRQKKLGNCIKILHMTNLSKFMDE